MTYREICTINRDNLPPSTAPDHKIAYLDIGSIPQLGVIAEDLEELNFGNAPSRARRIVRHDDVVVSTVRPYLQAFARIEDPPESLVASTGFAVLTPNGRVRSDFLFQTVCSHAFLAQLEARMVGSNYPAVNMADIAETTVLLPPIPEQRRIATILSSVDDAIAATRKVIVQTKRVKQGLIQTLMTRGIGHTRFKRTEIGEIPESWQVVPLGSLLAGADNAMRSGPFGSALLKKDLVPEGIPLLGIDNIHEEEFRPSYSRFVSPKTFQELQRYAVRPRDVVITIMGTVGRTCVLPANIGPALSSKHLWTMTFDADRYLPELVSLQLNWAPWVQRHFKSQSQGGIMKAIRSDVLKTTPLPFPPLEEQAQIAAILDNCRRFERTAEAEASSLDEMKRGLMQDLLTGRVRVQPD